MGYSFDVGTGDGVKTVFPFAFTGPDKGYIRKADVHVYVDSVETTDFTFVSDNSVQLGAAPAAPSDGEPNVLIRRIMPKDLPYSDFARGNNFGKNNVNYSFLQQLYLMHEVLDGFLETIQFQQILDMGGHRIVNLADAVDPQDALTKGVFDTKMQQLDATDASHNNRLLSLEGDLSEVASRSLPWGYTATGGETVLSPPYIFSSAVVFIDGVVQNRADGNNFSISSNQITLTEPLQAGEFVFVLVGSTLAAPDQYSKTSELQAADYVALRALAPTSNVVQVKCRSTLGDAGGGTFYWDAADRSAEVAADTQSGIYVAPNSDLTGASGCWVRSHGLKVDPRWFGAIPDFNTTTFSGTDNTPAFQGALDYAVSLSGVLPIEAPQGNFGFEGTLVLNKKIGTYFSGHRFVLRGSGGGAQEAYVAKQTNFFKGGAGSWLRVCEEASGDIPGGGAGVTLNSYAYILNLDFSRFNIIGYSGDAISTTAASGITGRNVFDSRFTDITIYGLSDGIRFGKDTITTEYDGSGSQLDYCERNVFSNVSFVRCVKSVYIKSGDSTIFDGCRWKNLAPTAVYMMKFIGGNDSISFRSCQINPRFFGGGNLASSIVGNTNGLVFTSCHLEGIETRLINIVSQRIVIRDSMLVGTSASALSIVNVDTTIPGALVLLEGNTVALPKPPAFLSSSQVADGTAPVFWDLGNVVKTTLNSGAAEIYKLTYSGGVVNRPRLSSKTVYVDVASGDDTWTGSTKKPYKTIKAAIDGETDVADLSVYIAGGAVVSSQIILNGRKVTLLNWNGIDGTKAPGTITLTASSVTLLPLTDSKVVFKVPVTADNATLYPIDITENGEVVFRSTVTVSYGSGQMIRVAKSGKVEFDGATVNSALYFILNQGYAQYIFKNSTLNGGSAWGGRITGNTKDATYNFPVNYSSNIPL